MRNVTVIAVVVALALGAGVASYSTIEREVMPPTTHPLAVYTTNPTVHDTSGTIDISATIAATQEKLDGLHVQKAALDATIANLENKASLGSLTSNERDELGSSSMFGKPRGSYLTQTMLAQEIERTERQLVELQAEQHVAARTVDTATQSSTGGAQDSARGTAATGIRDVDDVSDIDDARVVADGDIDDIDDTTATELTDSLTLALGVSLVTALLVLVLTLGQLSIALTTGLPTLAALSLALAALQLTGHSLNLMTLAGLALGMSIVLAETTFVGLLYADNPPAATLFKALRRVAVTIGTATLGIFAIALAFTIWASPEAAVFAPLIYAFTAAALFGAILSTMLTPVIAAWLTRRAAEKAPRHSSASGIAAIAPEHPARLNRMLNAGIAFSLRNRTALITIVTLASLVALGVFIYLGRTFMFATLAQYLDTTIATFTIVQLIILLVTAAIATGTLAGTAAAAVSIVTTLAAATAVLFAAQMPLESSALTGLFTLLPATVLITMLFGKVANQRYFTREERHVNILAAGQAMARPVLAIGLASAIAPLPFAFANLTGISVLFAPLVIAYAGGTLAATLVTIFIIPAVYETFCRVIPRRRRSY